MNAYKVETILSEDGALILKDLPFHVGDAVEVIILERSHGVFIGESPSQTEMYGLSEVTRECSVMACIRDL